MNGRIAKLLRKDSGFNPNDQKQRGLLWNIKVRWAMAGAERTLYQMLKKEYNMLKPKGKPKPC